MSDRPKVFQKKWASFPVVCQKCFATIPADEAWYRLEMPGPVPSFLDVCRRCRGDLTRLSPDTGAGAADA